MTKEQVYQKQMEELGIWQEVFLPELRTLCRCERELTRAEKAWSKTAPPGGKPSFLDDHFPVIQKLRAEILQHREALGLTPKAMRKITGTPAAAAADQGELITAKLDQIAARVSGYELPGEDPQEIQITQDAYEALPIGREAASFSDMLDEELRRAVHEDMG